MVNAAIHIQKASFGYMKNNRPITVVEESDLKFNAGDLVGLVGLNGSGKSTIIRTLCGLQPVLSGNILMSGKNIQQLDANTLARTVSVVLTERISGFNLTCFDAVAAGQMPYTNLFNQLDDDHLRVIRSAMQSCGIQDFHEKPLSELSDGLFQKTMIAKCVAQQTPVMLLDEPSAFLDYASKHDLFLLLKQQASSGKCIVISSHDLNLLMKYCNKAVLVKNSSTEIITSDTERWHTVFKNLSGGYL